jgi:hypothetical protein
MRGDPSAEVAPGGAMVLLMFEVETRVPGFSSRRRGTPVWF